MKFIHSFWSKPSRDGLHKHNWNYRHQGGFPSAFLFYCSWTYSCLSIMKYYPNLHLVTDDDGIAFFRDVLALPYQSFSAELNALDDYPSSLWALGKLYSYSIQDEPFCHIDGDVFLFSSALDSILDGAVFCQSFDHNTNQYEEIHAYVQKNFSSVPGAFSSNLPPEMNLINAGVIGGRDLEVFEQYTTFAFELINNNLDKLVHINAGLLNLYYEQFLLSNMAYQRGMRISSLFGDTSPDTDFAPFHHVPLNAHYVHLVSYLKKSTAYMEQVVARLSLEFPAYYLRLKEVFNRD